MATCHRAFARTRGPERPGPRGSPSVSCELWVSTRRGLVNRDTWPTVVGVLTVREAVPVWGACVGSPEHMELPIPSLRFRCEPKIALRK